MAITDSKFFFDAIRQSIFGGKLNQGQVDGIKRIIAYRDAKWPRMNDAELAYVLATVAHETAWTMQPIRERGSQAYLRGKPYWPYYGRGLAQLTWRRNYQKFGIKDPDEALEWSTSLRILFEGLIFGKFTGKKLADYISNHGIDFVNARRIINGTDDAHRIARQAESFLYAIRLAESAAVSTPPTPTTKGPDMGNLLSMLFTANPLTSTAGMGLILTNIGAVLGLLGSGATVWQIVQDKHFQDLIVGLGFLFSKDFNTSGGNVKY